MIAINKIKYQAYPRYYSPKINDFDYLPHNWGTLKLKYIFEIKKRIAGEIGYDVLSVTQKGIKIKDIESGEGQLSMDYSKYQKVLAGDFAMNHMDLLTGYIDISKYDGVTSPDYRVFSIRDPELFYSRYYLYLLQDGYKQRRFFHLGQGSAHLGRWRLPTEAFNEISYPHPALAEQIQITNFLDHETAKIDNLIEKQQQLIELLKEKRQAVISHAVTKGLNPDVPMKDSGVEWLSEVPEHWNVGTLRWYISISSGEYLSNDEFILSRDENNKFPVIGGNGVMGYSSKSNNKDVIIIGRVGALCGNVHKIEEECWITDNALQISYNNKYSPEYLTLYLQILNLNKLANQNTQPLITGTIVKNQLAFIPPINEQLCIFNFVNNEVTKLNSLIEKSVVAITLMQERRTALISAAVTGKIDVRNWVPPATNDPVTNTESQEATT